MKYRYYFCFYILFLCIVFFSFENPTATASASDTIYCCDISSWSRFDANDPVQVRDFWDKLHLAVSLQGIVNREKALLFFRAQPQTDDFWWNYLRSEGNWLSQKTVKEIKTFDELLETFAPKLAGTVIYGEKPWSLSNVASTISGVEKRVCLRFDTAENSLCHRVLNSKHKFAKPKNRLYLCDPKTGETIFKGEQGKPLPKITQRDKNFELTSVGSAKCDAYLWAKHNFLDTGKVSSEDMAYYLDSYWLTQPVDNPWNNTLLNHDFVISRAGFFFELHCWNDETPVDDPEQPLGTDLKTVHAILKAMHNHAKGGIIEIHGFTPWIWKYTSHGKAGSKHEPVPTEWESVRIFSAYNALIDADALGYSAMANGSFYRHFPMKKHYPQRKRPTLNSLKKRGLINEQNQVAPKSYITFYMGDYDCSPWLATNVPNLWNDPARGTIPCNWAFNPNLDKRTPHVLHYVRKNATENDRFISGDCGAGYLNPGMLTAPRLDPDIPDGWDAWTKHNVRYFKKYDLDITGFVIDGYAPGMEEKGLQAYSLFSPQGLIGQKVPDRKLTNDMPTIPMRHDLYGDPKKAGKELADHFVASQQPDKPLFLPIRTILQTPTWHKSVMEETVNICGKDRVVFLDIYSFFLLLKQDAKNNE